MKLDRPGGQPVNSSLAVMMLSGWPDVLKLTVQVRSETPTTLQTSNPSTLYKNMSTLYNPSTLERLSPECSASGDCRPAEGECRLIYGVGFMD